MKIHAEMNPTQPSDIAQGKMHSGPKGRKKGIWVLGKEKIRKAPRKVLRPPDIIKCFYSEVPALKLNM